MEYVKLNPEHGIPTKWNWIVLRPENLQIGDNVDIGAFVLIAAHNKVVIGSHVQIGGGAKIYSKNTIDETGGRIIIKDGACIGANSVVLPKKDGSDLVIGYGAKIGALAVIKKDVPDRANIVGVWA